jgi:hypothetical protein
MYKIGIAVGCVLLAGCASIQEVRQPQHGTSFTVDAGYQTVFGTIARNSIACSSPEQIRATLYPDTRSGEITDTQQGVIAYAVDVKDAGGGKSTVNVYSTFQAQRKFVPGRIKGWVQEGSKSCKFDGLPVFGPEAIQ